jgi:hypothetical protein
LGQLAVPLSFPLLTPALGARFRRHRRSAALSSVQPAISVQPTEVIKDFLQNIAPGKIESAARRLVAENATYISLNFENAELKQILPYAGTSSSLEAFISTFSQVLKLWTIEEFAIGDIFGAGET